MKGLFMLIVLLGAVVAGCCSTGSSNLLKQDAKDYWKSPETRSASWMLIKAEFREPFSPLYLQLLKAEFREWSDPLYLELLKRDIKGCCN